MCNKDIQKAFLNGEYSFTLNKVHTTDRITVHDAMPPEENKEVYEFVTRAISTYSAADAEEARHGMWILVKPRRNGRNVTYKCTACNRLYSSYYNDVQEWTHCPCGAKMQKEKEE